MQLCRNTAAGGETGSSPFRRAACEPHKHTGVQGTSSIGMAPWRRCRLPRCRRRHQRGRCIPGVACSCCTMCSFLPVRVFRLCRLHRDGPFVGRSRCHRMAHACDVCHQLPAAECGPLTFTLRTVAPLSSSCCRLRTPIFMRTQTRCVLPRVIARRRHALLPAPAAQLAAAAAVAAVLQSKWRQTHRGCLAAHE